MQSGAKNFVTSLTWHEVARRLECGAAAILPVGAGAKQHGLHMPLGTDQVQAEWFAGQLATRCDALIWPTLTYGHYPAFAAYAGSVSVSAQGFERLAREIIEQLLAHGPQSVLVLDTGISTAAPIERAIARLSAAPRIRHCCIYRGERYRLAAESLRQQSHGSHADEMETSVMLHIAPDLVRLDRAEASPLLPRGPVAGALTPHDAASPNYSASGSFGDPTKATPEKGRLLVNAILADLIDAVDGAQQQRKSSGTP